ncbi:interleukin-2-like [Tachyglossus aculeatus]|uniref:interleukin-2-like n=1 Tax=Tachyglossus aculeatus TaxID=9261 RepID=UPI0018F43404|nr:interleukin-2-like [Tachyglossus aculeatus]
MFKAFLLSCVALTFTLIADGAPTRQPLQPLQDDLMELQQIIKGLSETDRENIMHIPIILPKIIPPFISALMLPVTRTLTIFNYFKDIIIPEIITFNVIQAQDPQQKKAALRCFVTELKPLVTFLKGFINLDQAILNKTNQLLQNIEATTTALLENSTATNVTCSNDVEKNSSEFLDAWITLCHSISNA